MFCSMSAPDGSAYLLSWQASEAMNKGWRYSAEYVQGAHCIDLAWPAVFTGTANDGIHSLSYSMTVTDIEENSGSQTIAVSGVDNVTYALAHVLAVPPAEWQRKTSSFIYEEMASVIGKPVSITGDPITCHDIGQDETTYFELITRLLEADCRFYYADNNAWRINSFTLTPESFISLPLCSWSRRRSFLNRDTSVEFTKTISAENHIEEFYAETAQPGLLEGADLSEHYTMVAEAEFVGDNNYHGLYSHIGGTWQRDASVSKGSSSQCDVSNRGTRTKFAISTNAYGGFPQGARCFVSMMCVPVSYCPTNYDAAFHTTVARADVEPGRKAAKANLSSIYTNKTVAESLANKLLWLHNLSTNTITAACPLNLSVRCGQYIFAEGIPWIITEVRHSMSASGAQTEVTAAALGEYQW